MPGANFHDLIDAAVERGQYSGSAKEIKKWKKERLEDFRNPGGEPYLTHLKDGRWVQTTDRRTRDGGIAGIRNDVTQLKLAEEELAKNSAALEATLANMDQGIALHDAEFLLITWNQRYATLRDIPEDVLVPGARFEDIVRRQAERGVYAAMKGVMGADVEDQVRYWVDWFSSIKTKSVEEQVRADGSVHEVTINPLTDGGYLMTVSDITERKRAEEALRDSERQLNQTLDGSPIGVIITGPGDRVIFRNERWSELARVPHGDIEDVDLDSIYVNPGDKQFLKDQLKGKDLVRDIEMQFKRADGDPIWTLVSTQRMTFGGEPVAISWVTDITARKRAEQAFRDIFESSPIPMAMTRAEDGLILMSNQRHDDIMGVNVGHKTTDTYVDPKERDRLKKLMKNDGRVDGFEIMARNKDGETIWISLSLQTVQYDGETCFLAGLLDITERKQAEKVLRESESRFASMLRDSPLGVAVIRSADRKIIYVNARLQEMFGLDEAELQARRPGEYYADPDDRKMIAERLERDGHVRDAEVRLKRGDNKEFWASASFMPIEYVGEPARLAWYYDITERKQAEEALCESEARYETITANLPGVVYQRVMHPDGSISYPYVSPGVRALYEIEPDDILADAEVMLRVLPPDERERFFASLRESADALDTWNLEFRVVTKSGAEKWIHGSSRVTRAEGGEVVWDGFLLDITARRRAEESLRITEERQLLAMKAAAETSFTWDMVEDSIFLAAREGGFFGIDPESVTCVADWHKHVLPADVDILNGAIVAHAKGLTESMVCEYRIFDAEGNIRLVRQNSLAHRDAEGRATWLAGALSDISEEEEAKEFLRAAKQAAEEASAAKSEFLANMSHELRTPLNAIIGYSEFLLEEAEELDQGSSASDLRKIQSAGRHLLALINNVLDLSKIEAGRIEIFLETFNVAEMIRDVAATIKPLAEQNGNAFEVHVPDDLGTMQCYLTKVRQTLFNLLSNACKFTEEGRITLDISRDRVAPGEVLVFSVADTGVGMTAEQCSRVFDAFTQADSSTTRHFGGSGLGLAITKTFCQMLGGDIAVTSEQGVGSTFVIRLPATAPPALEDGGEVAVSATPQKPKGATSVLVVDDDPKVRDLLSRYLGRNGYHVKTAANGEEALSLAGRLRPDAITLDVLMPGMDGWAVLGALKGDAALSDIPVIMLSIVDDRNIGFSLGAADFLIKPMDREKLLSTLNKHCRRTRRRVLVVEDDAPTREMMKAILKKDKWVVDEAENGLVALQRVEAEIPDAILLDLIMPVMDGFNFIPRISANKNWRKNSVIVVTAKDLTAKDRHELEGRVRTLLSKNPENLGALPRILGEILPARLDAAAPGTPK